MQQRWVVVLLVLALAGLSWAVVVWPMAETQPEVGAAPAPDSQPERLPPSAAGAAAPSAIANEPSEPNPTSASPTPSTRVAEQATAEEPALFEHDMGPVAEYKERFASEPRDSAASDAELLVRDAFKLTDSASPVFRSVLCRKTLCKLEVRIAADQLGAYVAGMTRLTQHFDKQLAVTRTAQHADQVSLEVYAQRLPQAE